jgi:hypothetical protein
MTPKERSINASLISIDQSLAAIKEQTGKSTPNRLMISQAVDDAQRSLKHLQIELIQQSAMPPAAKLKTGLTVGDGFRIGLGLYLAVLVMSVTLTALFLTILIISGAISLDALMTMLNSY